MPFAKYWHVPGLTPGATYYWRVDEVEADGTTIHTGDLWSFTTAGFVAHNPDPPNAYRTALPDAVLSWGSGVSAASHDVYFGTSLTDVAAGIGGSFKGNQLVGTYHPRGLENGTAYFWRVDEVEADGMTKHAGEIWSFKTLDDPAFIGWWKFDEGQGNIAYDSSGYGNHGIIGGHGLAPVWTLGVIDGGLELGDGKYVDIDSIVPEMTSVSFTVSIWIKSEMTSEDGVLFGSNTDNSHEFLFGINNGNPWKDDGVETEFPPKVADKQWHMLTYVMDGKTAYIYVDGVLRATDPADAEVSTEIHWSIGSEWDSGPSDEFEGIVDDARFWIRSLSAEEVAEIFKGDVDLAHSPKPANLSTTDVEKALPLSWSPGDMAAQHDVYLGTDGLAVEGADTSDTTGIYRVRQAATSYTLPEGVEANQVYYWRIDEYNTDATISKGRTWSFTVADYLVVDDFEDYNNSSPHRIFQRWIDGIGYSLDDFFPVGNPGNGTGAALGHDIWSPGPYYQGEIMETDIVHGGAQSVPLYYDNSSTPFVSEIDRTFAIPQDWNRRGVNSLTLWFRGESGNAADQLRVALTDSTNKSATVQHPDAAATTIGLWTEWNIGLTDFAGVNARAIKKMTIGVGDRAIPQPGGSGKLYIDDIQLHSAPPAQ